MEDQVYLQNRMERARQELNNQVLQFGISHPSVLQQSMVLDELINQYNRIYYARERSRSQRSHQVMDGEPWSDPSKYSCNPYSAS